MTDHEQTYPGSCSVFVLRALQRHLTVLQSALSGSHCTSKYSLTLLNRRCVVKGEVLFLHELFCFSFLVTSLALIP